ncbi:solute carrier family 40 member 1-like [Ornithodoros turicata]|uniref:solute carrier family 40 member 1-like n=1 Tax=Ornithodoros turicata TaxID=34597 RepID=UPI00313921FB
MLRNIYSNVYVVRLGREGSLDCQSASSPPQTPDNVKTKAPYRWKSRDSRVKYRWRKSTKLYVSRALSSWGDNMWSFAVGLFYVKLYPDSLRLAAIYGFTACIAIILLGAPIGRWVDKTPRLRAAKYSLAFQNCTVVLCAVFICVVLMIDDRQRSAQSKWLEAVTQVLVVTMAVLSRLGSLANIICVEKDWLAVLAGGDTRKLSVLNAMVRRIDMVSKLLAPLLVGQVMSLSPIMGAIFLACWNIISVYIEYKLLHDLYIAVPVLALKFRQRNKAISTAVPATTTARVRAKASDYLGGWLVYLKHEVLLAGLSLAFTYMTVLMFDSITVGYICSQGVSESTVGIMSAVTGCVGILGTVAYPYMSSRVGLEKTGLYGFCLLLACITLCVGSVWAPGSPFDVTRLHKGRGGDVGVSGDGISQVQQHVSNITKRAVGRDVLDLRSVMSTLERKYTSVILLLAGMCLARFGLWIVDLTVNHFLQELVSDDERGSVNGVQYSINVFMDLLKFVLVILVPWVETFGILIIISFMFITAGSVLYVAFSKRRKHKIHLLPAPSVYEPSTPVSRLPELPTTARTTPDPLEVSPKNNGSSAPEVPVRVEETVDRISLVDKGVSTDPYGLLCDFSAIDDSENSELDQ